ncbi:MAG: winged helix-turn-helix transcriptional regulator [Rhizobium sp.]|nr:winged helix-turn-helix transcriptional regulator [Rhizobium sp.]
MLNPDSHPASFNAALVFAALGDHTRLSLLRKLNGGESRSIARLSADFDLTRQAVTKHLRVLEDAGLVAVNHIGRESQYVLRPEPITAARGYLDGVSQQWEDALGRLRAFVEREE